MLVRREVRDAGYFICLAGERGKMYRRETSSQYTQSGRVDSPECHIALNYEYDRALPGEKNQLDVNIIDIKNHFT